MLGELLLKIRKDKKLAASQICRETNINVGHLAHIEKEERTPSHKVLKKICNSLDVPYQQLMYTYDKELTEDSREYNLINHIAYSSIPAINNLDDMIFCPREFGTASMAVRVQDDSMEPSIPVGAYAYIEFNSPLNSKEIGLFYYDNKFFIRKLILRKNTLVLRADNKSYEDIILKEKDNFYVIGKFLGTNVDY